MRCHHLGGKICVSQSHRKTRVSSDASPTHGGAVTTSQNIEFEEDHGSHIEKTQVASPNNIDTTPKILMSLQKGFNQSDDEFSCVDQRPRLLLRIKATNVPPQTKML